MAKAPIIFDHRFAVGVNQGERVRASLLHAAAPLLLCRGADQVLVPVPTERGREDFEAAAAQLPAERRKFVRPIDTGGTILRRVRDFLEPLRSYAKKWPEDAFLSFSEQFLYHVALGELEKSAVAADSVQRLRGFLPLVDITRFRGEALYRLAELTNVIVAYEPAEAPRGAISGTVVDRAVNSSIIGVLDSAEYRTVATTTGAIGFLTHPVIAFRRLRRLLSAAVATSSVRSVVGIASAAADVGAVAPVARGVAKIVEGTPNGRRDYAAPFLPLGSATLGLYRTALALAFPGSRSPSGAIMVLESELGGVSWLNDGEELKLANEEAEGIARRVKDAAACRSIQLNFFAGRDSSPPRPPPVRCGKPVPTGSDD